MHVISSHKKSSGVVVIMSMRSCGDGIGGLIFFRQDINKLHASVYIVYRFLVGKRYDLFDKINLSVYYIQCLVVFSTSL